MTGIEVGIVSILLIVFLIYAVATLVALHWQILQEEHFLEAKYGPAYRRYRRSVPRYLGPLRSGSRPPDAGSSREVEPCD